MGEFSDSPNPTTAPASHHSQHTSELLQLSHCSLLAQPLIRKLLPSTLLGGGEGVVDTQKLSFTWLLDIDYLLQIKKWDYTLHEQQVFIETR